MTGYLVCTFGGEIPVCPAP